LRFDRGLEIICTVVISFKPAVVQLEETTRAFRRLHKFTS